jgi:hypothetical protein
MSGHHQPLSFFVKGAAALVALLAITLLMEPKPEVNGLRAAIVVGLGVIALKVVLRRYNIDLPPRRHRHPDAFKPPGREAHEDRLP